MFSPVGKKKLLIQQKFARGDDRGRSLSPSSAQGGRPRSVSSDPASPQAENLNEKLKLLAPTSAIAATSSLERALSDPGMTGVIMRKVMEATTRYSPHRDAILLKAFESKSMEYQFFRQNLATAFWLTFTDSEFQAVVQYFDPTKAGIIDGYSFMIAFTRLAAMRKDSEAQLVREKQEIFEKNRKDEEERQRLEKEKRNDMAVDYNFNAATQKSALRKLEIAAKNFDPYHPSSPSTAAFEVKSIKPAVFKEMLKLTFNLKVDRGELGAIIKEFCDEELQEVPSTEFLKFFFRVGFDARDHEKRQQREKQAMLDKLAEEERAKKALEAKNKNQLKVDYNFSQEDEINATEKLRAASEKYDRNAPGAVALDGFDCDELNPADFRELLKRVFNVTLTNTELGYVMQRFDIRKTGALHCKTFLTEMLALGRESRHKHHLEQLAKQRKLIEQAEKEHVEKMLSVQKDERVPLSKKYTDEDLQSALAKLTQAAAKFDRARGGNLESFEASHLDLVQFKRGLKRTFNLQFSAPEMGAILEFLGVGDDQLVDCHRFLTTVTTLGAAERARFRTEQLQRQREEDRIAKEEHERKIQDNLNKTLYDVDYEFSDADRDRALRKMIAAATNYDATHPAARGLQAFERKHMSGPEFKEIVRRTFLLQLNAKEVGALFKYFGDRSRAHGVHVAFDQIDCGDFLKFFLQVGVTERANAHREQLEKQRKEDEEREREHLRKVEELATRGTYQPDMSFTEADIKSIEEKLLEAAEKFDKNHPAAPSLEAFDAAIMPAGVFRENIKSIFGVRATPKEIGYLLSVYDKNQSGGIHTKEFLIKFFAIGKKARDAKRKEALEKQREALKIMKKEAEEKVLQLTEKTDYAIDPSFTTEDFYEAERRMVIESEKYDKSHPSAPNLDGFNGPVSPGAFRELMKRAFNIYLNPREVGSILQRFHVDNNVNIIDGKKFIIYFIKLGFDARAKRKTQVLTEQRQAAQKMKAEQDAKLLQAVQKVQLEVVQNFTSEHHESAMQKLIDASALYDKNAPGCVSLDSFHSKFLTPGVFREVVKRTFNIHWTAEELAAMVADFDNGRGDVDTNRFLVSFIKMGAEERERRKAVQLEKQRQQNLLREAHAKLKLKQAEAKLALKVNYIYSEEEKKQAFEKLAAAAKKYDKSHPAAMSLQGFEEKSMKPHVFREMLKRTFNFLPSPGELGALMHFFDQKNTGEVSSHRFLIHFLKLGIAARAQEHRVSLQKLREDAVVREQTHQAQMAAQWAKAELQVVYEFSEADRNSAMEKLAEAATKFDPASPGPMGLTAFQASVLSPAVFREMLKRCFNMKLTNGELAALIAAFDKDGTKQVHCAEFMVMFTSLGFERRSAIRTAQLQRQRKMYEESKLESEKKAKKADLKMEIALDTDLSPEDFESVLSKIRVLAANYDRSHPSAPSLQGFIGTDMKPTEFKHMLLRTFGCTVTNKELSALVAYFPSATNVDLSTSSPSPTAAAATVDLGAVSGEEHAASKGKGMRSATPAEDSRDERSGLRTSSSARSRSPVKAYDGIPRVSNRAFLAYFNKIQREEQSKRHKQRIARDRDFLEQQRQQQLREEQAKVEELAAQLAFTEEDERNCVQKIKQATREYATDSAPFQEPLQGFKGPALPPDKFRDLMARIFQVKFSFPEMGVLLSMLDASGLGVFDGPRFLTWFYKLARMEEKHMLGESDEQVTLEAMRRASAMATTTPGPPSPGSAKAMTASSFSSTSGPLLAIGNGSPTTAPRAATRPKRTTSTDRLPRTASTASSRESPGRKSSGQTSSGAALVDPFADAFGFAPLAEEETQATNAHAFATSTLHQAWFLPSVVLATASQPTGAGGEMLGTASQSWDGEEVRQHLLDLFSTPTLLPPPSSRHSLALSSGQLSAISSLTSSREDASLARRSPENRSKASGGVPMTAQGTAGERSRTKKSRQLKSLSISAMQAPPPSSSDASRATAGAAGGLRASWSQKEARATSLSPDRSVASQEKQTSSPQPSHGKDGRQEGKELDETDFLASLFAGHFSPRGKSASPPRKAEKGVIHDPVAHLLNIKKHFKQAPRYVVMGKKQKSRTLAPLSKSAKSSAPVLVSQSVLLPTSHEAVETSAESGSAARRAEEGERENVSRGRAKAGGGFIFPALFGGLAAPVLLPLASSPTSKYLAPIAMAEPGVGQDSHIGGEEGQGEAEQSLAQSLFLL